jgi:hypothetical protein
MPCAAQVHCSTASRATLLFSHVLPDSKFCAAVATWNGLFTSFSEAARFVCRAGERSSVVECAGFHLIAMMSSANDSAATCSWIRDRERQKWTPSLGWHCPIAAGLASKKHRKKFHENFRCLDIRLRAFMAGCTRLWIGRSARALRSRAARRCRLDVIQDGVRDEHTVFLSEAAPTR